MKLNVDLNCDPDPHPAYNGRVIELNDVVVGPRGIILSKSGEYINGVNSHFEFWCGFLREEHVIDISCELYKNSQAEFIDDDLILCTNYFNWYPFGHLWDSIQPLIQLKGAGKLLCNLPINIDRFDFHFSIFGFGENKRLHKDFNNKFYFVKKLLIPQLEAYPGRLTIKHFDTLRNAYINNIKLKDTNSDIIFVSRNNDRKPTNSNVIQEFCEKNGIKIIDGSETLEEKISYFYNAKKIIGIHGSLLKHCIFNNHKAKIVELAAYSKNDTSFRQNASFVTKDYTITRLQGNNKHEFEVPLDVLKGACNEI